MAPRAVPAGPGTFAPVVLVMVIGAAYLSGYNYWSATWGRQAGQRHRRQHQQQQQQGVHRRWLQEDASQLAAADEADARRLAVLQKQIEWLHIPKTGTSFGNSLVQLACPELEPGLRVRGGGPNHGVNVTAECAARFRAGPGAPAQWIGEHFSLENRTDEDLGQIFALVRSPETRSASGYHYIHRAMHLYREDYRAKYMLATPREICLYVNGTPLAHAARGAQVKMIAGAPMTKAAFNSFKSAALPDDGMVEEACRRLAMMAFVGISDYWNATVCLLHGMYGGAEHPAEYANVRRGTYQTVTLRFRKHQSVVKQVDCGDTADGRLFGCAMRIFADRISRHRPDCMQHLDAAALDGLAVQQGSDGTDGPGLDHAQA